MVRKAEIRLRMIWILMVILMMAIASRPAWTQGPGEKPGDVSPQRDPGGSDSVVGDTVDGYSVDQPLTKGTESEKSIINERSNNPAVKATFTPAREKTSVPHSPAKGL